MAILRYVDIDICLYCDMSILRYVDINICLYVDIDICRFYDVSAALAWHLLRVANTMPMPYCSRIDDIALIVARMACNAFGGTCDV